MFVCDSHASLSMLINNLYTADTSLKSNLQTQFVKSTFYESCGWKREQN